LAHIITNFIRNTKRIFYDEALEMLSLEWSKDDDTKTQCNSLPWTRARMWTIQGHAAFENAQRHFGRHCPLLPQAKSIKNKGVLKVGAIDARCLEVG